MTIKVLLGAALYVGSALHGIGPVHAQAQTQGVNKRGRVPPPLPSGSTA